MKNVFAATLAIALVATPAIVQSSFAQSGAVVTADPKLTYGWVFVEGSKTARTNVSIPLEPLGGFSETRLPMTARGPDISGVVRIATLKSDTSVDVRVQRATLVYGPTNNAARKDGKLPSRSVFLELECALPAGVTAPAGKQIPVQITLENTQNGAKSVFYIVVQAR
jgi:hypothetical protein